MIAKTISEQIQEAADQALKLIDSTAEYNESTYRGAIAALQVAQGMWIASQTLTSAVTLPSLRGMVVDLEQKIAQVCHKYNGWTNYETWDVALWIDNDQGLYYQVREMAEEAENAYELSKQLESMVDDLNPLASDASMFSDLLGASLRSVDWMEIAEHQRPDKGWQDEREEEDEHADDRALEDLRADMHPFFAVRDEKTISALVRMWDGSRWDLRIIPDDLEGWADRFVGYVPDNDYWCLPTDPNDYDGEARRYQ